MYDSDVLKRLYKTVLSNSYQKLLMIIEKYPSIISFYDSNSKDETLLTVALERNYTNLSITLINNNCDIETPNLNGMTPLLLSIIRKNFEAFSHLINRGIDVNKCNLENSSPLLISIQVGFIEAANQLLINQSIDINLKNSIGKTALFVAIEMGHIEIACKLIELGAEFKSKEEICKNPLQIAIKNRCINIYRILFDLGGDINTRDVDNSSPLHIAFKKRYYDVAYELIQAGAEVNSLGFKNETPLHILISIGDLNQIIKLVKTSADISVKDSDGNSVIQYAYLFDHFSIIYYFIQLGVPLNTLNDRGNSILHDAIMKGNLGFVKYLLSNGANIELKNGDSLTPFLLSIKLREEIITNFLISKSASILAEDKFNQNAVNYSITAGLSNLVSYLHYNGLSANIKKSNNQSESLSALYTLEFKHNVNEMINLLLSFGYRFIQDSKLNWGLYDNLTPYPRENYHEIKELLLIQGAYIGKSPYFWKNQNLIELINLYWGDSPLHLSCYENDIQSVKDILASGFDVNSSFKDSWTALHCASYLDRPLIVKLLLANKETDISARTSDKYLTYLHIACSRGNIDILKRLMK